MSIPQPRKDEQGKIVGDFYPLQRAEILALRKNKLINNSAYLHLALRFENPFCDRPIEILPKEFAMRWQMPESSVYEAISKLKEAGAIEIKYGKVIIQWVSQEASFIDSQQDGVSGNPESAQPTRIDSGFSESSLDSQKVVWDSRINSEISEEGIYKDRARSSDSLQTFQTTTDKEDAAAVEEICSNPNSPICQPTQEEIEQAHQEIARISPEIEINSQVKKLILEFWANLPAAITHTKKAVREGWKCDNLTGVFVKALKTPPEGAKSAAIQTKKELPKPNKEQRAELQKLGKPAAVEMPDGLIAEAIDFGGGRVLPWWRALNIPFEQLQQP